MYKGIYIALSGAMLKSRHMDIFAQNIANANTTGYKKERISFRDYIIPVDNNPGSRPDGRVMTELSGIVTDFSEGSLIMTGNPLDLAINGEGFFTLEGDRYTRNGNFRISSDGYLVTQDGVKVLGDGGPIAVQGSNIDITPSGEIIVDDISVGRLKIAGFPDKGVLSKLSGGMFTAKKGGVRVDSGISQGFLEGSNLNVIREMVRMLKSLREFESYQKMIQVFDEAASKTINEMGR
ncbi:MAG TPA: flagellar basal-body rod protein FlgF [Nitrospirae bacterium]|nr:flagellar basal-body rod protein FlgF [bacterium BMS3Abin06]HDH13232.1 flagellar basal-body rod protein FlgF [Nitrospirota bacterium]HDZ01800.1 flagellar basal-body rod protein FlgF [Nitrospirota bacterium]